jgi:hypothetical protein
LPSLVKQEEYLQMCTSAEAALSSASPHTKCMAGWPLSRLSGTGERLQFFGKIAF